LYQVHSEVYIIPLAFCLIVKYFSVGFIQPELLINSTRSSLLPSDRLRDGSSCLLAPVFVRVTASFCKLLRFTSQLVRGMCQLKKGFVCFNAMVHVSNKGDTPVSNVLITLHVNPHFVDHESRVWKLF
jgi:hypothetical protein